MPRTSLTVTDSCHTAARQCVGFLAAAMIERRRSSSNSPRALSMASANSAYSGVRRRCGSRPRPLATHSQTSDGGTPQTRAAVLRKPTRATAAASCLPSSCVRTVGRPRRRRCRPPRSPAPTMPAAHPGRADRCAGVLAGASTSEGRVDMEREHSTKRDSLKKRAAELVAGELKPGRRYETRRACPNQYCSRSWRLSTLPVGLRGSWSTKSTERGRV
jgi:hypothetical protein